VTTLFMIEYQTPNGQWAAIADFAPGSREWAEEYAEYLHAFSRTPYRVVAVSFRPRFERKKKKGRDRRSSETSSHQSVLGGGG
jgi:hypothetical protein